METPSKRRLLSATDEPEPNTNHDGNGSKLMNKASPKRLNAIEEALDYSAKRARNDAHSELQNADSQPKDNKALRLDVLLPAETLVDLFRLLNRDDVEGSGLVNRKFANASKALFSRGDVPLRKIERIRVSKMKYDYTTGLASVLRLSARRSATDSSLSCRLHWLPGVEWLSRVMRFSEVKEVFVVAAAAMNLWGIPSEIWHGLLNAFRDAAVDSLYLDRINFCPLAAAEVDRLKTFNVRTRLCIQRCHMLANQITDAFLLNLSKVGLTEMTIAECIPVDKGAFEASDDGALALCFPHGQPGQAERKSLEVHLPSLALTGEFYAKFLQKCHEAPEYRPLVGCYISPIPVEAERQIVSLNPTYRLDQEGRTFFEFNGAGCGFVMCRSTLKQTMECVCWDSL